MEHTYMYGASRRTKPPPLGLKGWSEAMIIAEVCSSLSALCCGIAVAAAAFTGIDTVDTLSISRLSL